MKTKLVLLAAAGALCYSLLAQTPAPTGAQILDKYVEVTGGRAAYEKLHSQVQTATMELTGKGIRFSVTTYRAAPNKSYMVMDMPGVGKMEEGTDGQVVWSVNSLQGPRVKEGDERALGLLAATFNSDLLWRDLFKSVENTGSEDVNGVPCYKVELTSKDGLKQTRYYDKKTGLLAKTVMLVKTQMGEIPTESLVGDYKTSDGILSPTKTVTKVMGQELVATVDSMKNNVEIEATRFAVPEEITALLPKK